MTRQCGHPQGWPGVRTSRMALIVMAVAALTVAATVDTSARKRAAKKASRPAQAATAIHTAAKVGETSDTAIPDLSFSDEFERAELIERMLSECRGIAYNAYELAQSSGEALELPAPIQLMTVRVHHPYCAELLRTYAPKTQV